MTSREMEYPPFGKYNCRWTQYTWRPHGCKEKRSQFAVENELSVEYRSSLIYDSRGVFELVAAWKKPKSAQHHDVQDDQRFGVRD